MDAGQIVQRYLETWNEADPEARRAAIAGLWASDGRYVDPLAEVAGHDQISDLIAAVQTQVPRHAFRLLDGVDAHHDVLRFGWELVPQSGGDPVAVGFDVAVVGEDGRIASVLGFLDKAPGS
jgi:hypothetical protein